MWCPWLAGTGGADANMDCMSTESCELLGLDTVDADSSSLGQPGVGCPLMHLICVHPCSQVPKVQWSGLPRH